MKLRLIVFSIIFMLYFGLHCTVSAQHFVPVIEVKMAPVKSVVGNFNISPEFIINDQVGIEPIIDLGYRTVLTGRFIGTRALGKYYVSPKFGADRWYLGPYVKVRSGNIYLQSTNYTKVAIGFASGYKMIFSSRFIVEAGIGMGRIVSSGNRFTGNLNTNQLDPRFGIDIISQLSVGYRFGTNKGLSENYGQLNRKIKQETNEDNRTKQKRKKKRSRK